MTFRYRLSSLSILLFSVLFTACSSSGTMNEQKEMAEAPKDLTEYLDTVVGVRVTGDGENAEVMVRGGKANELSRYMTPIYVIDGQVYNAPYSRIYQMMGNYDIKNIRVLKNAEAATYNSGSGQSVIYITTQKKES